jgi:hypothetical protein
MCTRARGLLAQRPDAVEVVGLVPVASLELGGGDAEVFHGSVDN